MTMRMMLTCAAICALAACGSTKLPPTGGGGSAGSGGSAGGGSPVVCDDGFADCDGDPANGCEANTTLPDNCGGCGVVCSAAQHCGPGCGKEWSCYPAPGNCLDGGAGGGEPRTMPECGTPADCDDDNPCTTEVCALPEGKCFHIATSGHVQCESGGWCLEKTGECCAGCNAIDDGRPICVSECPSELPCFDGYCL